MKTETFIFVHDQNIILDYERHEKFNFIENLRYIFLGDGKTEQISDKKNVIIARNFTDNLEQYPKLVSFTGWYLIWKNNLCNSEVINLFEYDINLSEKITDINQEINDYDVIGYIPFNIHNHLVFKKEIYSKNLISSINKNYNIDLISKLNEVDKNYICSMTSNHTFKFEFFKKYMDWVFPLVEDIKTSDMMGHEIERSIPAFCLLKNIKHKVIPNVLSHFQLDSHQTQGLYKNEDFYKNFL